MVRSVLGILVGGIVWLPAFFILARLLYFVWPDYALGARTWMNAGVYDFTAPMSVLNALFWILAEVAAGWVTFVIARRRQAVWALAALLMLYMSFNHLYYFWDRFPWWYNLAVAIPSGPAVLLGGELGSRWWAHRRAAGVP